MKNEKISSCGKKQRENTINRTFSWRSGRLGRYGTSLFVEKHQSYYNFYTKKSWESTLISSLASGLYKQSMVKLQAKDKHPDHFFWTKISFLKAKQTTKVGALIRHKTLQYLAATTVTNTNDGIYRRDYLVKDFFDTSFECVMWSCLNLIDWLKIVNVNNFWLHDE